MANEGITSSITREVNLVSWLVNSDLDVTHSDSTDEDADEGGLKECECNAQMQLNLEEHYHLPRSSPVISRKRRSDTDKQSFSSSNLCLMPSASDQSELSTSPPITVKSNHLNLHQSDKLTDLKKLEEPLSMSNKVLASLSDKNKDPPFIPGYLDYCNSQKDLLGQPRFLTNNGTIKLSLVSQRPLSYSSGEPNCASTKLRVPLTKDVQSEPKRRTFSVFPPVSGQISSREAREHGSFLDVNSNEDLYRSSLDLDKENAHFVVVDMVLEVLEAVKWAVCLQQLENTQNRQDRQKNHSTMKTDSFSSFDSGFEDDNGPQLSSNRYSLASFQSCQGFRIPGSAEDLAHHLVSEFRKQWFPCQQLKNPDNLNIALQEHLSPMTAGDRISLTEEIKQKSRMRGALNWAPPRFQIIFCVQPTHRRSDVIASQHFLCAGCGTEIEAKYIKKLRYCDYLGRYFCDGCHGGEESVIPGRVLNNWDFGRYPICHFSRQILDSIWQQPLFKLTSVAKNLYSQAKELQRFGELQEQLMSIRKLLSTCRLSAGILAEFEQLPAHLTQELHLFSMDDLIRVRKGQLCTVAKAVFQSATAHIDTCELCQAKGFICEFCHRKEVLFPFQRDTCTRCQDCRGCFHISCFRDEACPKCVRLQKRRTHQETINS